MPQALKGSSFRQAFLHCLLYCASNWIYSGYPSTLNSFATVSTSHTNIMLYIEWFAVQKETHVGIYDIVMLYFYLYHHFFTIIVHIVTLNWLNY